MTNSYKGASIGILYAVIVVGLIAAKLAGHIHWGWWIVLTPIWVPIAICMIAVILAILFFADASSSGKNPFQ